MSINFEVEKTFNVPKEIAYKALLDLNAAENWMQGLVRIEKLQDGPLVVGSEWKETRKMFGTEATELFEVAELKENEKIVLRVDGTKGTTGKGEYIYTYILTPSANQTEIKMHGNISGLTGMAKLLSKMLVKTFKKVSEKDLDSLKSYLEK